MAGTSWFLDERTGAGCVAHKETTVASTRIVARRITRPVWHAKMQIQGEKQHLAVGPWPLVLCELLVLRPSLLLWWFPKGGSVLLLMLFFVFPSVSLFRGDRGFWSWVLSQRPAFLFTKNFLWPDSLLSILFRQSPLAKFTKLPFGGKKWLFVENAALNCTKMRPFARTAAHLPGPLLPSPRNNLWLRPRLTSLNRCMCLRLRRPHRTLSVRFLTSPSKDQPECRW